MSRSIAWIFAAWVATGLLAAGVPSRAADAEFTAEQRAKARSALNKMDREKRKTLAEMAKKQGMSIEELFLTLRAQSDGEGKLGTNSPNVNVPANVNE